MRVVVMFDLPTDTSLDRKNYRAFRKFLINEGFVMLQFSIYTKICLNMNAANVVATSIRKNKPPKGLIQMMTITEAQFSRMEFVRGEEDKTYIMNTERTIVL